MKRPGWSIRRKFTALLLLPLLSLAALWVYAADLSLGNALTLQREDTIGNHLGAPLGRTFVALQDERREAMIVAVAPETDRARLSKFSGVVDKAMAQFLKEAHDGDVRSAENDAVRKGVDGAEQALGTLAEIRQGVAGGKLDATEVLTGYTGLQTAIGEALRAMTILPDQEAQDFGQALYNMVPAGDLLSQEDALVSSAAAGPAHRLDPAAYSAFVQNAGAQRFLIKEAIQRFPEAERAPFLKLAAPDGLLGQVLTMEEQIIVGGPGAKALPFPIEKWRKTYDAQAKVTSQTSLDYISLIFVRTGPPAHRAFVELILAGLLGLIALVASVIMSIRMARSLVGDVSRLRSSARNLTDDQLRDVVGRLRRGESVDIRDDMARPAFVNREMAELGASFDALQLTAVELAREDIRLHSGINEVFVNLARRSQTLVHRQLRMLDSMERHEENPEKLEELFRLDQLATRMRRYAEGLIIVSGAPPGRFWRHPVPAVDVVRGAIAETEDYARVVVLPMPTVGIAGRAAADVIHLLAELIENAEVFSPSDSEVRVSLGTAAGGLIIEIDDRGLGMPSEELTAANERINSSLDVSTLDSTRLGLVTVGRLAQRHNINVSLRQSPYGGVNAVVLIPQELLEWEPAAISAPNHRPAAIGDRHFKVWSGSEGGTLGEMAEQVPGSMAMAGAPQPRVQRRPQSQDQAQLHAQGAPRQAAPMPAPTQDSPVHGAPAPGGGAPGQQPPSWPTPTPGAGNVPRSPAPAVRASAEADMIDGLPRRVPQASLARELANEAQELDVGRLMDWGGSDHLAVPEAGTPWAMAAGPAGSGGGPYAGGTPFDGAAQNPDASEEKWGRYEQSGPYEDGPYGGPGPFALAQRRQGPGGYRPEYGVPYGEDDPEQRPERVRSMMSSLQAGAARARAGHVSRPGEFQDDAGVRPDAEHVGRSGQGPFPPYNQYTDQGRPSGQ